ncbi:hypothetical protein E3T54_12585 [Cryobacterium sp. Sr8]|uniref:DUF2273 domain-containing protein n=1 Tax=Cryobacterium psychrotolerans TaxID=386301 RepID=A0A1G9FSP2_9MICO|nr:MULTISPECIES: hypothetical protein [Cryobacterium]TFD47123.1 hypothetical protein E3T33_03585 [Cryobacterium sp. TMT1-2-1]TFD75279.1 hypothetical protein E3T54_12585 [Cryobacterium sp. Sr8]TFD90610.1 hypothetical protein E3T56_01425 [Cryobacterium psychrotolerans]SDK91424.1 hypothetical protein SAMN05216282_1187 [Cryobacterium psychrotolerans]
MNATTAGILIGAILVIVWITLGFGAFVLVLVGMIVGGIVGRIVDGKLDLPGVVDAVRGRRSSS